MCFISAKLDKYVVKICRPKAYILDSLCFENSFYIIIQNMHKWTPRHVWYRNKDDRCIREEYGPWRQEGTEMLLWCVTCGLWSNVRKYPVLSVATYLLFFKCWIVNVGGYHNTAVNMYSPYAWISSQTLSALFTSISLSSASTSFLYVACLYTAFFHAVRTLWFLVTASIPGACWMSVIWSRSTFSRLATCSHLGKKRDTSLMWSSDIISSNCWSVTAYFNARADMVSIPLSAELYWRRE